MKTNAVLACGCCLFAGLWLGTLAEKSAEAQNSKGGIIKAQELQMVDGQGNVKALFIADTPKLHAASLVFVGKDKTPGMFLTQNTDGTNGLSLLRTGGKLSMTLDGNNTQPSITMYDSAENPRVSVGLINGEPKAVILDTSGGTVSQLPQ